MSDLEARIRKTEALIESFVEDSTKIMLRKNRERGDAWRGSGLFGQFIEIYSMYARLRVLIWEMAENRKEVKDWDKWRSDVRNALVDMRNFTILAELCLEEDNIFGSFEMSKIKCLNCGENIYGL